MSRTGGGKQLHSSVKDERRFLTQLIIGCVSYVAVGEWTKIYPAWCFDTNLNPTYTQNTDRDLLRTVPGIAPVISRSLNSPIFHLNTSHLAQPLAQPLIAARSSGHFLTRP